VVTTAKRHATYDDVLNAPDHLIAEIVDGELHTSPRPQGRHGRAMGGIHARLHRAFDDGEGGPGGWWMAIEPELHLGPDVMVPDVCGWRRDRVPEYDPGPAWEIAPDWVCEVLSPSTGRYDRMRKLPAYARHQVDYAWLVDPVQRTVEVFRLDRGQWKLLAVHGGDEAARMEPFEAMEFPLATLWLPDSPPA
jgi:Uma2 family endonuclease